MIEKVKLSLWDFFAYILSGGAVGISVLVHLLILKVVTFKEIMELPSAVILIIGILSVIILGLLFEPLSNLLDKLLGLFKKHEEKNWKDNIVKNWQGNIGFKEWDAQITTAERKARETCPIDNDYVGFQYCKNYVLKRTGGELFSSFSGKFGFYRNIYILLVINILLCPIIYSWNLKSIIAMLILIIFAILYRNRSKVFYRHMSVTVYTQFIDLVSNNNSLQNYDEERKLEETNS